MNYMNYERAYNDLKEQVQNDFINRLAEMVEKYMDDNIKSNYEMTLHELKQFKTIVNRIEYINSNLK